MNQLNRISESPTQFTKIMNLSNLYIDLIATPQCNVELIYWKKWIFNINSEKFYNKNYSDDPHIYIFHCSQLTVNKGLLRCQHEMKNPSHRDPANMS